MPEGKHKSRSMRRVYTKLPGGRVTIHYEKRKPGKACCARCGAVLAGVPHAITSKLRQMAKTEKRPSRPYGGVLCSKCMRMAMKEKARGHDV